MCSLVSWSKFAVQGLDVVAKKSLLFCDRQDYIKPEVAASFAKVIQLISQHDVDQE
jgi:hypothetical protein